MLKIIPSLCISLCMLFLPCEVWSQTLNISKQELIQSIEALDKVQTHLDVKDDKSYEKYQHARQTLATLVAQRKQLILDAPVRGCKTNCVTARFKHGELTAPQTQS